MKNRYFPVSGLGRTIWALLLAVTFLLAAWPPSAFAVDDGEEAPKTCQLRVASGSPDKGGFYNMFKNMHDVCGQEVVLCQVPSNGSLDNVTLASTKDTDLAMSNLDILTTMKDTDDKIGALKGVFPLNYNLLHVLAKLDGYTVTNSTTKPGEKKWGGLMTSDPTVVKTNTKVQILKFSDLKNKTVALVGSAQAMGITLEKTLGYGMQFVTTDDKGGPLTDAQAVAMLKAERVHAVFSVTGYTKKNFFAAKLTQKDNVRLVPFDLSPSPPYVKIVKNYPNLQAYKVPFAAVPSLLVSRPFRADGPQGKAVTVLQSCLKRKLDELKDGAYEPGWNDVEDFGTFGWPMFSPTPGAAPAPVRHKGK